MNTWATERVVTAIFDGVDFQNNYVLICFVTFVKNHLLSLQNSELFIFFFQNFPFLANQPKSMKNTALSVTNTFLSVFESKRTNLFLNMTMTSRSITGLTFPISPPTAVRAPLLECVVSQSSPP